MARMSYALFPQAGIDARPFFPVHGIQPTNGHAYPRRMEPTDAYDNLRRNLTLLMDAARDGLRGGPTGVLQLEAETDIGKFNALPHPRPAREKPYSAR